MTVRELSRLSGELDETIRRVREILRKVGFDPPEGSD